MPPAAAVLDVAPRNCHSGAGDAPKSVTRGARSHVVDPPAAHPARDPRPARRRPHTPIAVTIGGDEPLAGPDDQTAAGCWPVAVPPWTRADWLAAGAAVLAIAGLLTPFLWRCMHGDPGAACSDYGPHVHVALAMLHGGIIEAYFLYHLTVALFAAVPGLAPAPAALLGTLVFHLGLALVVYALTRAALRAWRGPAAAAGAAAATVALLLVAHGVALDWDTAELYLGFVGINSYHNPTINALKPFALLLLPFASATLAPAAPASAARLAAAAVAAVLSTLAKPSYAICLLPALGALMLIWTWRGRPVDWRLGTAVIAPMIAILAVQYLLTYGGGEGGVAVAPLAVLRLWGATDLPLKFLLSILFPLAVALLFPRQVLASAALLVSWATFACGAAFTYLLAESGERLAHGNFGWSGEIALFVLFVASTLLVLRIATRPAGRGVRPRLALCGLAFAVHLVSGVLWYGVHLHLLQGEPFPHVAHLTPPNGAGCFAAAAPDPAA